MDVSSILSHFEKVKAMGRDRWMACCPAHEDKSPSMAIRVMDDGRILIHCFAQCSPIDILGVVGLEMSDLFPERLGDQFRPERAPFTAADVLRVMKREATVVAIAAADVAEGKTLSAVDADRVILAAGRFTDALEYVNAI